MPDPTGIEAHQERLYQEAQHMARVQVVRHALTLLDPARALQDLSYRDLLARLAAACTAELARLEPA